MPCPRPSALRNGLQASLSQTLLIAADLLAFNIGPWIAMLLVVAPGGNLYSYIPQHEIFPRIVSHALLSLVCVGWFWGKQCHYAYRKPFYFELKESLGALAVFAAIELSIAAFAKWQVSRYLWTIGWGSIFVLQPLLRLLARSLLRRLGLWCKQCIIIGAGNNAQDVAAALQSEGHLGLDIQYFYSLEPAAAAELMGLPVIHGEDTLWRTTDPRHTQYVIAVEPEEQKNRELLLLQMAQHGCQNISIVPSIRGLPLNSTDMTFIFRREVLILRVQNKLASPASRALKRGIDLLGAVALLTLLSPLLLTLGIMVMRGGGNPLFGHARIGQNGRPFRCMKFRTMAPNADELLEHLLAADPAARAEWEQDFKLKNDPRITPIGSFLRKTSLDELPQLWNVLKGEMSLVGPRPIVEEELPRYGDDAGYYLMAKPGMTGLWQVSGRNDVSYETRVYFDAWYVKNWSLWTDIVILLKTAEIVLRRDGAY